jgi:archaellum biogenesis ATPase FlaH
MPDLNEHIKNEFEALSSNFIVVLDTRAENYSNAVMESAKFMVGKEQKGVYVTVSRPYRYILKEMQKRNIPTAGIFFLDCVSYMAGEGGEGCCAFVENPAALEEISMYLTSSLNRIDSPEKFLIFDSLSTLLIYNSLNSVREFSMFLMNKLRLDDVNGVLVIIEREAPEDLKQILIAMCDKTITV